MPSPTMTRIAGTDHPLSPRIFTSLKAWKKFCKDSYPYTSKDADAARAQLDYSRRQVETLRELVAHQVRLGSPRAAAATRIAMARHQEAVRRGEAYFRALAELSAPAVKEAA